MTIEQHFWHTHTYGFQKKQVLFSILSHTTQTRSNKVLHFFVFLNVTVMFQTHRFFFFLPAKMLSIFWEELALSLWVAMVAAAWPAGSVSRCQTWPPTWNCDRDNRHCGSRWGEDIPLIVPCWWLTRFLFLCVSDQLISE